MTALGDRYVDGVTEDDCTKVRQALAAITITSRRLEHLRSPCEDIVKRLRLVYDTLERQSPRKEDVEGQFVATLEVYWRYLSAFEGMSFVERLLNQSKTFTVFNDVNNQVNELTRKVQLEPSCALEHWQTVFDNAMASQQETLEQQARRPSLIQDELPSVKLMVDAAVLLRSELEKIQNGKSTLSPDNQDVVKRAYDNVVSAGRAVGSPTVQSVTSPEWFLQESDVQFKEKAAGAGSFGTIHHGKLLGHMNIVVKLLKVDNDVFDEALQQDFLNEVNVMYKLRHDHVVKLIGANHIASRPFIVMEFATKGNMDDFLKRPGNKKHMWRLFYEAGQGLMFLHNKNMVHADLKLSNILITGDGDGRAQIADFGMSRVKQNSNSKASTLCTNGKQVYGALRWRAPEFNVYKPQPVSDVFSYGMCIIEAYLGGAPYPEITSDEDIRAHIQAGKPHPRPDGMPDDVWQLVVNMTNPDLTTRIKMPEVLQTLKAFADREQQVAVDSALQCHSCFGSYPDGSKFCNQCGGRLIQKLPSIPELVRLVQSASSVQTKTNAVQQLYRRLSVNAEPISESGIQNLLGIAQDHDHMLTAVYAAGCLCFVSAEGAGKQQIKSVLSILDSKLQPNEPAWDDLFASVKREDHAFVDLVDLLMRIRKDNRHALGTHIPTLVSKLRAAEDDEQLRSAAVSVLVSLTRQDEGTDDNQNLAELRAHSIGSHLVSILKISSEQREKLNAAILLDRLIHSSTMVIGTHSNIDDIEVLVTELRRGDTALKPVVARALAGIAKIDTGAKLVGACGGLMYLVDLIRQSNDTATQTCGLRAVAELVKDPFNGAMFAQADGLVVMEDYFQHLPDACVDDALRSLHTMVTTNHDLALQIASSRQLLDNCLRFLMSEGATRRNEAVTVILALVKKQPAAIKTVESAGGFQRLRVLAETGDKLAGQVAFVAIETLLREMREANLLPPVDAAYGSGHEVSVDDVISPFAERSRPMPERFAASLARGSKLVKPDRAESHLMPSDAVTSSATLTYASEANASPHFPYSSSVSHHPLIRAVEKGDDRSIARLLAEGVHVDTADRDGATPLMLASKGGHLAAMEMLLYAGAQADLVDYHSQSPLIYASCGGRGDVIEAGYAIDRRGASSSQSELPSKASTSRVGVVTVLLQVMKHSPTALIRNVNSRNRNGESALSLASRQGDVALVRILLRHGASVTTASKSGDTLFDVAYSAELRELLTAHSKRQRYREQSVALLKDPILASTSDVLLQLAPLITSVYDLSAMLVLLKTYANTTFCSQVVHAVFDHIVHEKLILNDNARSFVLAAIDEFHVARLVNRDESDKLKLQADIDLSGNDHVKIDAVYIDVIVSDFSRLHSQLQQARAVIAETTLRVRNLQVEVSGGLRVLECVRSRKLTDRLHQSEQHLRGVEERLETAYIALTTLGSGVHEPQLSQSICGTVVAVACFLFPPVLSGAGLQIVDLATPVNIVRRAFNENDVARFIAEQSEQPLPQPVKEQLEQHGIPVASFETVLREAISIMHPEYLKECTARGLPLEIDGGKSTAARNLLQQLEQDELAMLTILSVLLTELDTLRFSSSYVYMADSTKFTQLPSDGDVPRSDRLHDNSTAPSDSVRQHNDHQTRVGMARFQGILGNLRNKLASTDTTSGKESTTTPNASRNAVATYVDDCVDAVESMVRLCKVCVFGSRAADFIRFMTKTEPRQESTNTGIDWTDWHLTPADGVIHAHEVVFWNFPDDAYFDPAHSLFFSESSLFVVCTDGDSVPHRDECTRKWTHLIHSYHEDPRVVIVAMGDRGTSPVMSSPGSPISPIPTICCRCDAVLRLRLRMDSASSEIETRRELIAKLKGFILLKPQLDILQRIRNQRAQAVANLSMNERAKAAFVSHDDLLQRTRNQDTSQSLQASYVDDDILKELVEILHELGEIHCFGNSQSTVLSRHICLDIELWASLINAAMRSSYPNGRFAHTMMGSDHPWNEICDSEVIHQLKQGLVASRIMVPSKSPLHANSDLLVPVFHDVTGEDIMMKPLTLERAQEGCQRQSSRFLLKHQPPDCLINQLLVVSFAKLQEHCRIAREEFSESSDHNVPIRLEYSRNCLRYRVGDVFAMRVVLGDDEGKFCVKLEAVVASDYIADRQRIYYDLLCGVEDVLDRSDCLDKDDREELTWLRPEWGYEDTARQVEKRTRAVEMDIHLLVDVICVVGPSRWGKTSLVKSLTSNTPSLELPNNRTVGVDLIGGSFLEHDKSHELVRRHVVTFCDFAGETKYQAIQSLFFPCATLFVLCVDLHAYAVALAQAHFLSDDEFPDARLDAFVERQILRWVDKVYLARANAQLVLVATKSDLLQNDAKRMGRIRDHFLNALETHSKRHTDEVAERLQALHASISGSMVQTHLAPVSWLTVSCTSQSSVSAARDAIERVVVSSEQSRPLPPSYARALIAVQTQCKDLDKLPMASRVKASVHTFEAIDKWLEPVVPDATARHHVLSFLHLIGAIIRYEDFGDVDLTTKKLILAPQLVVDFARELFSYKSPSEIIPHVDLVVLPLWATVGFSSPFMLEMKLILRNLRLVNQVQGHMKPSSDLLVPAFWRRALSYGGGMHAGPSYLRYTRSGSPPHPYHVRWKYYLGQILDDQFFERIVLGSYSTISTRQAYNGLIKYTRPTSVDLPTSGPTAHEFCQVWIEWDPVHRMYVVWIEAVASSHRVDHVWLPFCDICTAIERVLAASAGVMRHLCAVTLPDAKGEKEKEVQVEDAVAELRNKVVDLEHDCKWMPPKLNKFPPVILVGE